MGSTASPEVCNITLHVLEKQILEKADHILTWWRYRDDILVIYDSVTERTGDYKTFWILVLCLVNNIY